MLIAEFGQTRCYLPRRFIVKPVFAIFPCLCEAWGQWKSVIRPPIIPSYPTHSTLFTRPRPFQELPTVLLHSGVCRQKPFRGHYRKGTPGEVRRVAGDKHIRKSCDRTGDL